MSDTLVDPLGIGYRPGSGIAYVAVDWSTFRGQFNYARVAEAQIADSTSPFDVDHPTVRETIYVLTSDGQSGYAIRPDGELVYVFSRVRGRGDDLVEHAVKTGARHLDCFDGYLPTLYGRHGFLETSREPNWTPGGPDVVWMALNVAHPAWGDDAVSQVRA